MAAHTVAELAGAGAEAAELPVLLLIDTAGCDMEEQAESEGDSKVRAGRAPVGWAPPGLPDAAVPALPLC